VLTLDIQAGGTNHHYGRVAHWLASNLWRRMPEVVVNIKVGTPYRDLRAVGDGLAHIGVFTPAAAARMCLEGLGVFETPRPKLRSIGVVPHRDTLIVGVRRELGLDSLEDIPHRRVPLRLAVPLDAALTGHASRQVLARCGITPETLEGLGGRWIDAPSAQAAWKMVASGEADGMINESIPQAFRPLAKMVPLRLLSIPRPVADDVQAAFGYRWREVPAGTVAGQDEPVIGLSWEHWIVVAHADVPDDVAYALADIFVCDTHGLERQYTADNRLPPEECSLEYPMRPEVVAGEVTIPLHPGATRRYREAGIGSALALADAPT
jgi:TRAP-type uncharacterized transport system substrate-binding protein